MDVLERLYPEKRIAGFCRHDHRVVFYSQVNAILRPDMTVLEFGAGRGKWAEVESGYKLWLTTLRGKCKEVIGTDVDPAVLENPLIDRAVVTDPAKGLPFEDDSIDLIVSWAVFEHVADPEVTAAELKRVLKPGGWVCAWTPSKWSYFALGARLIPNRFHARMVSLSASVRRDEDVFPTVYKLNTRNAIARYFPDSEFDNMTYFHNGPPNYHFNSVVIASLWRLWMWLLPSLFAQQMHVFLRKKAG